MPLSEEQKQHLQQNWLNIQLRANDEAAKHQNDLLYRARAKNNSAAIPLAYSEAALFRLETTVRTQLDWTVRELEAMGVQVDRETEQFVVQHFNEMTGMIMPLHFPPGMTATIDVSAHQRAHARARMRLNKHLQRESASAIMSLRLKLRSAAASPTTIIYNHFHNSPGARSYYQSVDNSADIWQMPAELTALISNLSSGHSDLEIISHQIERAPDRKSTLETVAKWVTAVSSIEALGEKFHAALPSIDAWIHHVSK